MKQNTSVPGTPLSREAMKNVKGGFLPAWTAWTCTNYPGFNQRVVDWQLTNPEANCANISPGGCSYYTALFGNDWSLCEVITYE